MAMSPILRRWILLGACVVFVLYTLSSLRSPPAPNPISFTVTNKKGEKTPALPDDYDWRDRPQHHPVRPIALPTGSAAYVPPIQFAFENAEREPSSRREEREKRRAAVKKAFTRTWKYYRDKAWMYDEIRPVSGGSDNTFGGWGATLVDSLDTLAIMGLHDELEAAVKALDKIKFNQMGERKMNIFETTIRYLGGLMAAYDLTDGKYPTLLDKAKEVGELLYASFDTPNRWPSVRWDWVRAADGYPQHADDICSIAEIASCGVEFIRLSQLTGDPKYYDAVQRITDFLETQQGSTSIPGLWPYMMNGNKGKFTGHSYSLGGMADSAYEYFPKQFLMLGGLMNQYKTMYEGVIAAAKTHLFFRPLNPGNKPILISGSVEAVNMRSINLNPEGQHLSCFLGGMVGLGARAFGRDDEDLTTARQLVDGCIWAYNATPSGIMPEVFSAIPCDDDEHSARPDCEWSDTKWYEELARVSGKKSSKTSKKSSAAKIGKKYMEENELVPGMSGIKDRAYGLRPEAIESLFILYRITGDATLQDDAWNMWTAIEAATKTKYGYAAIEDVTKPAKSTRKKDKCESFWTAETLKYFYLMFEDPGVVSLDDYVFNTEAHPLKRPGRDRNTAEKTAKEHS